MDEENKLIYKYNLVNNNVKKLQTEIDVLEKEKNNYIDKLESLKKSKEDRKKWINDSSYVETSALLVGGTVGILIVSAIHNGDIASLSTIDDLILLAPTMAGITGISIIAFMKRSICDNFFKNEEYGFYNGIKEYENKIRIKNDKLNIYSDILNRTEKEYNVKKLTK